MFGYGGDHPRLPLPFPGARVVLLAEVPVEDAVGIELDLLVAGAVLTVAVLLLLLWLQSGHGTDRPILLSGEGARVPPLPFLENAGADGFLLCGRPRRRISRLRGRHFGHDTGLRGPHPLLPTAGCPFPVGLIVCPTGDGEGEIFPLPGQR